MLHLTWKGLRGRKKESSLLLIVLALAFMLSAALAIVLPSTQAEIQLQREKSYGKWQLMLYGEDPAICTALETAAAERGASSARLTTAGVTEDGDTVSVITPELMDVGALSLLEGRLPEAENEILIVDTQFSGAQGLKPGDEIELQYTWNIASTESGRIKLEAEAKLKEYQDKALAEARDRFYVDFQDLISEIDEAAANASDAEYQAMLVSGYGYNSLLAAVYSQFVSEETLNLFNRNIEEKAPLLQGMTDAQVDELFNAYLFDMRHIFNTTNGRSNSRILVPFGDRSISVTQTKSRLTLVGAGYGENTGAQLESSRGYSVMTLGMTYTVSGVLKGYEATWDTGGHTMPDAFLSTAGASVLDDGIAAAKAELSDLTVTPYDDTLLLYSDENAADFYNEMAAVYEPLAEPHYEVELYFNQTYSLTQGLLTGLYTPPEGLLDAFEFTEDDALPGRYEPQETDGDGSTGSRLTLDFSSRTGQVWISDGSGGFPYIQDDNYGSTDGFWADLTELDQPGFRIPLLDPLPVTLPDAEALYQKNEYSFRINTYSYPDETSSADATVSTVLNGILVLMTACAVLVICMVQSKRRARSIVLLRAIGLQNGQAVLMQLGEAALFLLLALVIGLPLGWLGAEIALRAMGSADAITFDLAFLLRSVLFGAASLLVGLQLPVLTARRMPLTGRTGTVSPSERAANGKEVKRGGLLSMERAAMRFHRRRDRTARLLCALALVLALLTLLLSHFALNGYRAEVERPDMPDYTIKASFAMSPRYLREKMEQFAQPDELGEQPSRVESYLAAEHVTLTGYEASPIVSAFGAGNVSVAGLAEDSLILQRVLAQCGEINTEKLLSGEGCILLMPNYKVADDGAVSYSSDPADALRYQTDDTIRAGDMLTLSATSHGVSEGPEGVYEGVSAAKVEVLAVLHEYDLWLFGESARPLTLLSGQSLIKDLYPNASQRFNADQARWSRQLSRLHCEDCKGKTYFQFYASDSADHSASYWNLAQSEGMELKNYYKEKLERLTAGENQQALTVLLGAAAVLLVLIILTFILTDLAEQGRRRVGILRALGVSGRSMLRTQLLLSMREALEAVLVANAVMAVVLLICALAETGWSTASPAALLAVLGKGLLWQYPWRLHGLLCLAAWALTTLLRTLPYRRLCKNSVIGTIKGLERGE